MLLDPKIPGKIATLDTTYSALRYRTVSTLDVEMAETLTHFRTPPADETLEWKKVYAGDRWGDDWQSAWFRGSVTIPHELDGQTVFLRADTGSPEALFFLDGQTYGVFDVNHPARLISLKAEGGRRHEIALEAYTGHSFPGTQPFDVALPVVGGAHQDTGKKVTAGCRTFNAVDLVTERADVSAFVFELRAMRQLATVLDANSLRRGRIHAAMQEIFTLVYAKPEDTSEDVWRPALAAARGVMRSLLELKNGPTTPQFGIIGHSHIDTAWLWTVKETTRKLARTFSSILSLMDQYPEFRFTSSAAMHMETVQRLYPELFERIKARVAEGRWEINGAMWVEPDCNIPSGESFVRQCLIGQRSTREMFGVTSDTLWQPDVFGYSAALPQILHQSGVRYFCTTKISWNDTNRFPYDTFVWQGIDGSTVLSHFNLIHCWPDPETLVNAWNGVQHKDVQDRRLMTFGYGDGGGGPQSEMIEMARLTKDLEGCPKTEYASITEFMDGVRDEMPNLPRWVGELYLELHRGTLTSIAQIKRLNRQCEFALRDAEFVSTMAHLVSGTEYPADSIREGWKVLLLNQFHDILPGSSIAEVNDEAISMLEANLKRPNRHRDEGLAVLARSGQDGAAAPSVAVVNSLSWARQGEIELTGVPEGARPAGDEIVAQKIVDIDGTAKLVVSGLNLAPLSVAALPLTDANAETASLFSVNGDGIETQFARVAFDSAGRIVSFYDKAARRELVTNGGAFNTFLLGEDVPAAWDNWDIDRDQRWKLQPQDRLLNREVVADGPLQLRIRQTYRIGQASSLTQDIVFHAGAPQVDFETVVDWKEKYQFLKVGFTLDVLADTARHEIQFGHVTRSTHDNTSHDRAQFDVCAHKWTDISENGYGVAFLNDSKYACTVKDGEYRLSLLKSGRHPDARGDEGIHRFRYAILPHTGGFSVEGVVRPAYEFNHRPASLPIASAKASQALLATVDAANVIVEAVKWAEEGDALILRLYEAGRTGTHARIVFGPSAQAVFETNLLEEEGTPLPLSDNAVELYFRPFEIKTLKVVPKG